MSNTSELAVLAVSAIAAFAMLYWWLDWSLVSALGITVVFSLLALLAMYYRSKRSS